MSLQRDDVRAIFSGIVPSYDFLNHFLSFGMDFLWRRELARELHLHGGEYVLDTACGTGDTALAISRVCKVNIFGLDFSSQMLIRGREKASGKGIKFLQGRAEQSPFRSASFDAISIAFGIRNLPNEASRMKGLREFHRLLKQGGRLAVLEFSHPNFFPVRAYIKYLVPIVGNLISRSSAYTYLRDTIEEFPAQEAFAGMMTPFIENRNI
jgi:demethylmenaquinone methyltransferase/2-methoxy-6-polyprenyl-1,4-benzoquinol methylase